MNEEKETTWGLNSMNEDRAVVCMKLLSGMNRNHLTSVFSFQEMVDLDTLASFRCL